MALGDANRLLISIVVLCCCLRLRCKRKCEVARGRTPVVGDCGVCEIWMGPVSYNMRSVTHKLDGCASRGHKQDKENNLNT
jgi:hypothetical protein